jgi:putative spermidine/putrescine transport system permease protein
MSDMAEVVTPRPPSPGTAAAGLAPRGSGWLRLRRARDYLAIAPFLAYVTLFLLLPTGIVVIGAFQEGDGAWTLGNIGAVLETENFREAFVRSIVLSAQTAIAGAVLGGLFAWAVAISDSGSLLRRNVIAACGVLAQFGGVMLAFAFLATFGFNGLATMLLRDLTGVDVLGRGTWIYGMTGLAVVYTFFQIPLMVIIFLPALDGLRKEWQEASSSLGGTGWHYWRHVGGPILAPSFLGALLLLFANAFSAYATAAALVSQGAPIVTLQIRAALSSEVALGHANVGKALALGMIVIVAIVMVLYALIQRRASRWVR